MADTLVSPARRLLAGALRHAAAGDQHQQSGRGQRARSPRPRAARDRAALSLRAGNLA
ncbi:MAG: hypothetical protein R3F43_02050 [bacterium]